jgi:hypothetical protein
MAPNERQPKPKPNPRDPNPPKKPAPDPKPKPPAKGDPPTNEPGRWTWDKDFGWIDNWGGEYGGNDRPKPKRPGAAWQWDEAGWVWVKPPQPTEGGPYTWDDNRGWVSTGGPGPTPPPPGTDPPGRPGQAWVWDGTRWVKPAKPGDGQPYTWDDDDGWVLDTTEVGARGEAQAYLEELLRSYGLESLIDVMKGLITQWGANTTVIMSKLRESDPYKKRFKGLELRRNSGYSALNEAEYIGLEDQYKKTMSAYGLDPAYYSQDQLAGLIGYDVSAAEVNDRIAAGRQMLMSADQSVLKELREYYGLGQQDLLSYLLDPSIGQQVLDRRLAKAQIGGAAERYGFEVGTWDAERWVSSAAGSNVSGFDLRTAGQMDTAMAAARRIADRETTLAAIDRERFTDLDAIDATFGDEDKRLASERRAKRERARFQGSSGAGGTSLSQDRNL